MKSKLSSFFNYQDIPFGLKFFPKLLRIIVWLNQLLMLRNWYVRKELRTLIQNQPEEFTFLDAGCGYGDFIVLNAPHHPKATFVGVDAIQSNCEILNSYAKKNKCENISTQVQNLVELKDKLKYDIILCNTVLQYIKDDEIVLAKLFNALKPYGTLILYVPIKFKRNLIFFKILENRSNFIYDNVHVRAHTYTEDVLTKKIVESGYIIENKIFAHGKYGAFGFEISELSMWLLQKSPYYMLPLTALLYLAILPCTLLLYGIDFLFKNTTGNGILISAKKI